MVIYLDKDGKYDYPLNIDRYLESYSDLIQELYTLGINTYIGRGPESYKGKGVFLKAYRFDKNRRLINVGMVTANLIFDKGDRSTFPEDGFNKINHPEVDKLCNNKLLTNTLFKRFSPKTISVLSHSGVQKALNNIPGIIKVFKPTDGFGGEGIIIDTDSVIVKKSTDSKLYPAIIQEFIDSKAGIPGLTNSYHDLRVIIINGEIVQASVRTPKKGSLLANVAMGGSITTIPLKQIPKKAVDTVFEIDSYMKKFGDRIYSVDLVFDGTDYKLMELNSRPGWHPKSVSDEAVYFIVELAKMLAKASV